MALKRLSYCLNRHSNRALNCRVAPASRCRQCLSLAAASLTRGLRLGRRLARMAPHWFDPATVNHDQLAAKAEREWREAWEPALEKVYGPDEMEKSASRNNSATIVQNDLALGSAPAPGAEGRASRPAFESFQFNPFTQFPPPSATTARQMEELATQRELCYATGMQAQPECRRSRVSDACGRTNQSAFRLSLACSIWPPNLAVSLADWKILWRRRPQRKTGALKRNWLCIGPMEIRH